MQIDPQLVQTLCDAVNRDRLVETAVQLIGTPSPTREGAAVADVLADILSSDGFTVERPEAGWPSAPAVAVRWESGTRGKTLQFNGHLDTVHLPFVPPNIDDEILTGSGAIDMKGGVAAMVEALRVVRDTGALKAGGILLTAHDLHEAPWGDGSQIDRLLEDGYAGDAALIPEYTSEVLPVIGRGLAVLEVSIRRDGEPVHEVLGGIEQPSVIYAGADLVQRFSNLQDRLADRSHPSGLRETAFVGMVQSGEIYNQSPVEFRLSGTRRWLPGTKVEDVRREFHTLLADVEEGSGTHVEGDFHFVRDAYELEQNERLVEAFQSACTAAQGTPLPTGVKPFVDDGNTFCAHGIPCITHGPAGSGAHTVHERVAISELERVAWWYALTAVVFCDA